MAFINNGFTGFSPFQGVSVGSLNQGFGGFGGLQGGFAGLGGLGGLQGGLGGVQGFGGQQGIQQLLMQVLTGLTQLMGGWGQFAGGQQQFGFPQQQFAFPQQQQTFSPYGYPAQPTTGYSPSTGYGTGVSTGYGTSTGTTGVGMKPPTDPNELASYLQAQLAGGALQGNTTVRQSDALAGTRFGQVADSTQWHSSVARAYAYQFAGQALEYQTGSTGQYNPLSAQGLANAANQFDNLNPDAKLFTQVASVFKGNLLGGPGNYDNGILKQLLQSKGLTNLANQPQVGLTDVQTIGAVTNALQNGQLSLQEVINSGAISQADMPRYLNIINYVQNGNFNQDLTNFDANPVR